MKKIILISACFLIISSCNLTNFDEEKSIAYYHFENDELDKILFYNDNDTLTFANQENNNLLKLHLNYQNKTLKNRHASGFGFFSAAAAYYFYYDKKEYNFCSDNASPYFYNIDFKFIRWPNNTEKAKENLYQKIGSSFSGYLDFNKYNGSRININYNASKSSLIIGNKTYRNVFIFESMINNSVGIRTINRIFYDEFKGLIGFDDIDGKEWRIKIN